MRSHAVLPIGAAAVGMILLGSFAGAAYADNTCKVTETCEGCSEEGDTGTKLRLYTQHCKEQAASKGYEFLSYHAGPVAQCDFIRKFQSDVDCRAIGLQPVK
jgi:hypothetical protein